MEWKILGVRLKLEIRVQQAKDAVSALKGSRGATEASETAGVKHPEMHEGTYQRKALCQRMLRKERRRNPVWKLELRKTVSANRIQKRAFFTQRCS